MKIKNIKDLGLPQGILKESKPNGAVDLLLPIIKRFLTYLGVAWSDPCCPEEGGGGFTTYIATLTQSGTTAPVATVLTNTIGGTFTWAYDGVGAYTVTNPGKFPDPSKVFITMGGNGGDILTQVADADTIAMSVTALGTQTDDNLFNTTMEIRVYP